MTLLSWLFPPSSSNLKRAGHRPPSRKSTRPPTPPRTFLPRCEGLETRELLSTLTVTNNLPAGEGSLRDQIAAAESGDTIVFDSKLGGKTILLCNGPDSQLVIDKTLTIQGLVQNKQPKHMTLAGCNSRVLEVLSGASLTISNIKMAYGDGTTGYTPAPDPDWTNRKGGAILNFGTVTLANCTVTGSTADQGGGIYNVGVLTLERSSVGGNTAVFGGRDVYNTGSLTLIDSSIGDLLNYGSLTIINSAKGGKVRTA